MSGEARRCARVAADVRVLLADGCEGVTRDVSASGIYFVTDADLAEGGPIRFSVEFGSEAGKMYLECCGEVVRIERGGGKLGVAARITESRLQRKSIGTTEVTS
jgi:hypothetical protein